MFQRIKNFFDLSLYEKEEERFIASALQTIVLVVLATDLAGMAIIQISGVHQEGLLSLSLSLFVLVLSLWCVRHGYLRLPSILILASSIAIITFFGLNGRGVNDVTTTGYFLVMVMAGLLLGKDASIIFWFLSVLCMAALNIAQLNGLVAEPMEIWPGQVAVWTLLTGVAAVLLRLMMGHLLNGLQRARDSESMLRTLNDELEQRVEQRTHDLKLAKDEAEAARERAEKADQIKSQFLASMSHELRTPLNAILNFTEMMTLGMVGPVNDQQKDVLDKSLGSGRHLLALINDVLDIAKMQSGMLALFIEDGVNLYDELNVVYSTVETLLNGKPIRLIRDIDDDLPIISGDRRRIRQILLNLLSNAAKFTEEGTITLSAKRRGNEVLFAITDTGPGISEEEQQIIFEPFVQAEAGIRHAGGTGLGLPITKHLVEAHGGRLWVESETGDGAAFYVILPVKCRHSEEGSKAYA